MNMTANRFHSASTCAAIAAALLVGLPSIALAALIFPSSGDRSVRPFYTSQAYSGYTYDGGGDNSFAINNGLIWDSNVGFNPGLTTVNVNENHNGATVSFNATSIPQGFYSARNQASVTVTNAQDDDGYYAVAGSGSRTSVQFFTPSAAAARSTFTWRVTGSENAPIGRATSRLDFVAGTYSNFNDVFFTPSALSVFGPGTYTYNLNAPLNQVIDLIYWTSAFVELDRGVANQGQNVSLFANYSNTYELVDIDLFDIDDNPITEWTLFDLTTQQTVFNQIGRIDTPPSQVPEPATLGLLTTGLIGLGFLRRRPRRI